MVTSGIAGDRWERYLAWNAALSDVVYGPDAAGLPVFLDLEESILEKATIEAGGFGADARQELLDAVRPTLNAPDHPAGMFGGHLARLARWRVETGDPPPTIALLAVLSLAAEDMRGGDGFAPHNYYSRLMPLLDVDNEAGKARVVRAYRDCSRRAWASLNDWLEGVDGERGLPTAFALGNNHVGLPVSQAILRATDRYRLLEFFADFGFAPRSHIPPRDMEALLAEWIARIPSPASNAMQALWRRPGARERIVEGACRLLESWDGPALDAARDAGAHGPARGVPIRLTALLRTFPTATLELNLSGPIGDSDDEALQLLDANDVPLGAPVAIEPMTDHRWRLAEPEQLDPSSMLDGWMRLRDGAGLVMNRRPKRVVALTRDDLLQVFVEVERLPLGETSMVLAQADLADAIAEALGLIARPGFVRSDESLRGLPSGWTLFSDLQVLGPLPTVQPDGSPWEFELDLNVLQPLSTSQLVIEEGIRLPGHVRRFSSLAPPEVRAVAEEATSITIELSQIRTIAAAFAPVARTFEGGAAVLRIEDLAPPDGDYEIVATHRTADSRAAEHIDSIRLRLRSADQVNPAPQQHPPLARALSSPAVAALTASISDEPGCTMRGTIVSLAGAEITSPPLVPPTAVGLPAWWDERAAGSQQEARVERMVVPGVVLDDCFRTGRHVIQLPTYDGTTRGATFQGYCRQCGIVKRYPSRYRSRASPTESQRTYIPPAFDPTSIPRIIDRAIRPDVALDALSHDRAGSARAFGQLALQIEPSQLFADRFLRGLESLGHLEVRRDLRTLAPLSWEVAPPALAQAREGVFVLAGARSRQLCAALEVAADELGLRVERCSQEIGPDRIRVKECDLDQAELIARRVFDGTGASLAIVPEAAFAVALQLPPLSAVVEALPRSSITGCRSANRWDERVARWVSVPDTSAPGAYQLLGATITYCIRDAVDIAQGTMRRGDARLVKHAASSHVGAPLLGYDAESETLYAPLGAELPGLYSRAAVLASGLLPRDDTKQDLIAYPLVPSDLAEHLATLMVS